MQRRKESNELRKNNMKMFIRLNKVKTVVPNIKDLSESARQNSKLKQRISQYDVLSQNQASVDSK